MNKLFLIVAFASVLFACGQEQAVIKTPVAQGISSPPPLLTVYKDPNCGCCKHWIAHVEAHGFPTITNHPADMSLLKQRLNIVPNLQSCHSAVTPDGYIFEGHVPAKFMQQFLADPVAGAIGLTVPAMVVGSPGMEVGDKFRSYQILLLKDDGSSELYQTITSYQQQF